MSDYRFVHAADLHLDSPFRGLLISAPDQAEILRKATFDVYERTVDLCIEEGVDALLVAGDVFDSAENSLSAQIKFRDGLNRLAGHQIRSFVCHGNHDPLDGWRAGLEWPAHAHRFGPNPEAVPFLEDDPESPIVYGVSYPTREVRENLITRFPEPDSRRPAIGLLHANVGAHPGHANYAPCTVDDLVRTGFHYWALGHVHTRNVVRGMDQAGPVIVYPGNTQGRHPNESGQRGVYLVTMDEHGIVTELQFRPLDVVRWENLRLPIDSFENEQDLIDGVEGEVRASLDSAEGRHLVYRIQLTGRGVVHSSLVRQGFLDDLQTQLNDQFATLRPFALCERIDDTSAIPVDREELARGGGFVADLLSLIDQVRADPVELRRLTEDAKLEGLYQHPRARRYLSDLRPDESTLDALVESAEQLLLDGLVEEAN